MTNYLGKLLQHTKTVEQHLQEIPDPEIRAAALKNLWKEYGTEWAVSLPAALGRAFLWTRSAEGYKYWLMYGYSWAVCLKKL
jgi:hypothetical protein